MITPKNFTRIVGKAGQKSADQFHEDHEPRVNGYLCAKCGHLLLTADAAEGTTPAFIRCVNKPDGKPCKGGMSSLFYSLRPADYTEDEVTHEWVLPSLSLFASGKMEKSVRDHVVLGGLLMRQRKPNSPWFTHGGALVKPDGTTVEPDAVESQRKITRTFDAMREQEARNKRRRDLEEKRLRKRTAEKKKRTKAAARKSKKTNRK